MITLNKIEKRDTPEEPKTIIFNISVILNSPYNFYLSVIKVYQHRRQGILSPNKYPFSFTSEKQLLKVDGGPQMKYITQTPAIYYCFISIPQQTRRQRPGKQL